MSAAPGKQEFQAVGSFDQFGLAEGPLPASLGPLAKLRLNLHSSSANWAILSEIFLKRASWELPTLSIPYFSTQHFCDRDQLYEEW